MTVRGAPDGGGVGAADAMSPPTSGFVQAFRSLYRSKLALFSVILIVTLVTVALLGERITPFGPHQQNLRFAFLPPAWTGDGDLRFVFGTDGLGRDILSRLVAGARISLYVGLASVVIGGLIGVTLGIVAGFFGGWVDVVVMRFVDLQMAFPTMFVGLFAMALLGTGLTELIVVIAIVQWAYYARVARAEAMRIKELEYFQAARALGTGTWRIMLRHVLPNSVGPILVVASFSFSTAIFYESALSFFGVGVPPNIPTWGNMLADARNVLLLSFWYPVFPGLAITVTVLAFNLLGDWLRDFFDVTLDD
jgi:peptide/nickel transport system permease protein